MIKIVCQFPDLNLEHLAHLYLSYCVQSTQELTPV